MATAATEQRCQRIGCDAKFTEDENTDGSCRFHPGPPLFHDGGKEWSCCKQKSHDFSMFLELPGCQTGKHTSVKPQPAASPVPKKGPMRLNTSGDAATCSRCKQGFYCSDHGAKLPTKIVPPAPKTTATVAPTAPPKSADLNAVQTCKNKGCGLEYTEKENTSTSCRYHPGPAVFRDRQRGWACCDIHVKDFNEFLEISPCTTGWHSSNPDVVRTEAE